MNETRSELINLNDTFDKTYSVEISDIEKMNNKPKARVRQRSKGKTT